MTLTLSFSREADSVGDGWLLRGQWTCKIVAADGFPGAEIGLEAHGTSEADAARSVLLRVTQARKEPA